MLFLIFLRIGPRSGATRESLHNPFKKVDLLTLLQIRDNVAARTLTSIGYTDTKNMTVENCVNYCNTQNFVYAGVEFGQECCKWCFKVTHNSVFFPISVVLITRFGI
jgi:hypothetical protein